MLRRSVRRSLNQRNSTGFANSNIEINDSLDPEQLQNLKEISVAARPSLQSLPDDVPIIPDDSNISPAELDKIFPKEADWHKRLDKTFRPSFSGRTQRYSLRRYNDTTTEESTIRSEEESMPAPSRKPLRKKKLFTRSTVFDEALDDAASVDESVSSETERNTSNVSTQSTRRSKRIGGRSDSSLSKTATASPRESFRRLKPANAHGKRFSQAIDKIRKSTEGATISEREEDISSQNQESPLIPPTPERNQTRFWKKGRVTRKDVLENLPPEEPTDGEDLRLRSPAKAPIPAKSTRRSTFASVMNSDFTVSPDNASKGVQSVTASSSRRRNEVDPDDDSVDEASTRGRRHKLFEKRTRKTRISAIENVLDAEDSVDQSSISRGEDLNSSEKSQNSRGSTTGSETASARSIGRKPFAKKMKDIRRSVDFTDVLSKEDTQDTADEIDSDVRNSLPSKSLNSRRNDSTKSDIRNSGSKSGKSVVELSAKKRRRSAAFADAMNEGEDSLDNFAGATPSLRNSLLSKSSANRRSTVKEGSVESTGSKSGTSRTDSTLPADYALSTKKINANRSGIREEGGNVNDALDATEVNTSSVRSNLLKSQSRTGSNAESGDSGGDHDNSPPPTPERRTPFANTSRKSQRSVAIDSVLQSRFTPELGSEDAEPARKTTSSKRNSKTERRVQSPAADSPRSEQSSSVLSPIKEKPRWAQKRTTKSDKFDEILSMENDSSSSEEEEEEDEINKESGEDMSKDKSNKKQTTAAQTGHSKDSPFAVPVTVPKRKALHIDVTATPSHDIVTSTPTPSASKMVLASPLSSIKKQSEKGVDLTTNEKSIKSFSEMRAPSPTSNRHNHSSDKLERSRTENNAQPASDVLANNQSKRKSVNKSRSRGAEQSPENSDDSSEENVKLPSLSSTRKSSYRTASPKKTQTTARIGPSHEEGEALQSSVERIMTSTPIARTMLEISSHSTVRQNPSTNREEQSAEEVEEEDQPQDPQSSIERNLPASQSSKSSSRKTLSPTKSKNPRSSHVEQSPDVSEGENESVISSIVRSVPSPQSLKSTSQRSLSSTKQKSQKRRRSSSREKLSVNESEREKLHSSLQTKTSALKDKSVTSKTTPPGNDREAKKSGQSRGVNSPPTSSFQRRNQTADQDETEGSIDEVSTRVGRHKLFTKTSKKARSSIFENVFDAEDSENLLDAEDSVIQDLVSRNEHLSSSGHEGSRNASTTVRRTASTRSVGHGPLGDTNRKSRLSSVFTGVLDEEDKSDSAEQSSDESEEGRRSSGERYGPSSKRTKSSSKSNSPPTKRRNQSSRGGEQAPEESEEDQPLQLSRRNEKSPSNEHSPKARQSSLRRERFSEVSIRQTTDRSSEPAAEVTRRSRSRINLSSSKLSREEGSSRQDLRSSKGAPDDSLLSLSIHPSKTLFVSLSNAEVIDANSQTKMSIAGASPKSKSGSSEKSDESDEESDASSSWKSISFGNQNRSPKSAQQNADDSEESPTPTNSPMRDRSRSNSAMNLSKKQELPHMEDRRQIQDSEELPTPTNSPMRDRSRLNSAINLSKKQQIPHTEDRNTVPQKKNVLGKFLSRNQNLFSTPLKTANAQDDISLNFTGKITPIKKLGTSASQEMSSPQRENLSSLANPQQPVSHQEQNAPGLVKRKFTLQEMLKELKERPRIPLPPARLPARPPQTTRVTEPKEVRTPLKPTRKKVQLFFSDGKAYKPRKLAKPLKFVTDKMYRFITKKMESEHGIDARGKSEDFVWRLCDTYRKVTRRKNTKELVEELLMDMVRCKIVSTYFEFYRFIEDFMPYNFRVKSIPCIGSDLAPRPTQGIHENLS